jgi:hypothetical protein
MYNWAGLVTSLEKEKKQEEKEKGECCMKSLMAILVLVMAVPAMAVVTFSASDAGSQQLLISYTTTDGDAPRGVALRVSLSGGATMDFAAAPAVRVEFNTFIDYAFSQGVSYTVGSGHPFANPAAAGALTADAADFSLCAGVLDQDGKQAAGPGGAVAINLFKIQLKGIPDGGQTTATISADTLRGPTSGVVGSVLNSNLQTAPITCVVLGKVAVTDCVNKNAPFYNDWLSFGKPDCWCYARNCKGDADGLKQGSSILGYVYVFSNDLNILIKGWNIKEAPKGPGIMSIPGAICADFARDKQGSAILGYARVFSNDLNILIANWNIKEAPKGPGVADCTNANLYNFFVTPK